MRGSGDDPDGCARVRSNGARERKRTGSGGGRVTVSTAQSSAS